MPTPAISAQEQLMLKLTSCARLDPVGEAVRYGTFNDGLAAGTISTAPKVPLAFTYRNTSAASHSSWILAAERLKARNDWPATSKPSPGRMDWEQPDVNIDSPGQGNYDQAS